MVPRIVPSVVCAAHGNTPAITTARISTKRLATVTGRAPYARVGVIFRPSWLLSRSSQLSFVVVSPGSVNESGMAEHFVSSGRRVRGWDSVLAVARDVDPSAVDHHAI